jgi:hypothetical protein
VEAIMAIPVLIEKLANNGYRAKSGEPLPLSVEAPTRDEALTQLREQIDARLNADTELVGLEIGPTPHPWAKFAGMFKDDPNFQEVLDIIAENRRIMDADPNVP